NDVVRNRPDRCREYFGNSERVGAAGFPFDVKRFRRAASQALPQCLLHTIGTERENGHVAALRLFEANGLLESELVVGRDDEFQSALVDAPALGNLDAGLRVRDLRNAHDGVQRGAILGKTCTRGNNGTSFATSLPANANTRSEIATEALDAILESLT